MARMPVAERRARLVDAAITVMSRDGVAHTTTRSIVAEAGMQIGVFHYCFHSKDELTLEVMRTISERSFAAVGEVLQQTDDAAELIRLATRAYWAHIQSDPLEHLLTYELTQYALRQPGQEHAAQAQYDGYITGMQAFLEVVADHCRITWRSEVEVLARYVLAVVEGVTFQWLVNRDDRRATQVLDALVGHLQRDAGVALVPAQP